LNTPALTWGDVRRLALSFEGAEEALSYGTAALKVNRKMFVRLLPDRENLVVRMPKKVRDHWMREKPDAFYVTDHYVGPPYVLVRLVHVSEADLAAVLGGAWGEVAEKSQADK
jgi:hypothetical protein